MLKNDVSLKKLNFLSKNIQIILSLEELKDCQNFLKPMVINLNKIYKTNKLSKNINIENYLKKIWGAKIPFLTLKSLQLISKSFKQINITIDELKKQTTIDDKNLVIHYNK